MKLLLILILITCLSCEKPDTLYCDVKNPINDLDWLRLVIKDRQQYNDSFFVQKMELPAFGEKGFLFQLYIKGIPSAPPQKYYYSCKGTVICYDLGGVAGTNCGTKIQDVKLGDVIYKSF
jgi:hypothetical protein